MRHTFLFTRQEGLDGITAAAVLTIGTEDPSADSHDEALERFEKSITEWIEETDVGREAWEQSHHDFNIGDACNYGLKTNESFAPFADRNGIVIHELDTLAWDSYQAFDKVLADVAEEDPVFVLWEASGIIEEFACRDDAEHELMAMESRGCRGLIYNSREDAENDVQARKDSTS